MSQNNPSSEFAALFSYAREDDNNDGNRLSDLKRHLQSEIKLQTGHDFKMFQDKDDTDIGQRWYNQLMSVIDGSTFLITITPTFLNSSMCREEVHQFTEREKVLGRNDLIVPILYVSTPGLSDKDDPIAADLNSRQYYPWGELRFEPYESSQYRSGIAYIAEKIIAAVNLSKTTITNSVVVNTLQDGRSDPDNGAADELGFIEVLAETEDTLPLFIRTIEAFGEKLNDLTAMAESATSDMNVANESGKPASAKLSILYRFAKRLEPTADDMETLADDYMDQLSKVDLGMKVINDLLIDSNDEENLLSAQNLRSGLNDLVEQGTSGINSLRTLGNSISDLYRLSSTTKPVLKRINTAIYRIIPSQDMFINWRNNLDQAIKSWDRGSRLSGPQ